VFLIGGAWRARRARLARAARVGKGREVALQPGLARLAAGEVAGFAAAPGPAQGRLESTLAGHRPWCGDGFVDLGGRHLG
jgi:hypothetical protein